MKNQGIADQVLKNSAWNFISRILSKLGAVIFVAIIARVLLPEKFGIYSLAMSIMIILMSFVDLGINQALITYFSESLDKKKKKLAVARYKYLLKVKLTFALLFSLALILLAYPLSIYIFKKPDLFLPLIFASFYLFVYVLETFYTSFFYIYKRVDILTLRQLIWEPIRIGIILIAFMILTEKYYVIGVISTLIISTVLALLILFFYLKKIAPFIFEKSSAKVDKKRINKFLIYIILVTSLSVIFVYVDVVMIGLFLEEEFVGFYRAVITITEGLGSLVSIAPILLPFFVVLKREKLEKAFNTLLKYTAIITIPMIFGTFVLGKWLIRTVYGNNYLPAVLPLYVLSFFIFEIPILNAIKSLFSAKEKPQQIVNILIIATMINIVLNFALINYLKVYSGTWAITGAAIATIFSRVIYLSGLVIYTRNKLGIRINLRSTLKPIISGFLMFVILFLINLYYIQSISILRGFAEVILGAIIYFSILILIRGVTTSDYLYIKSLIKRSREN